MARNIYKEALDVQMACNPSGVTHSLYEVLTVHLQGADTAAKRSDPAVVLFVAKLADLVGLDYQWPSEAEVECERRAKMAAAGDGAAVSEGAGEVGA